MRRISKGTDSYRRKEPADEAVKGISTSWEATKETDAADESARDTDTTDKAAKVQHTSDKNVTAKDTVNNGTGTQDTEGKDAQAETGARSPPGIRKNRVRGADVSVLVIAGIRNVD